MEQSSERHRAVGERGRVLFCTKEKPRWSWLVTDREIPGCSSWHYEFSYHFQQMVPVKTWAHLHQKRAGSLSLKYFLPSREQTGRGFELQSSLVRTQVPTTRSQKIATANRSPVTQSAALQVPEQQDTVRRCSYLNGHWWTSRLLQNAFLKLSPNHSSLELGFFNVAL